ncbi:hypothetical protein [Actinokineospora cianjurensis]|uniref:Uncharacterized protein n=1 Tax=Actinokineospora cianjurensis TaxID=585224 RepID=A0A421B1V2_9PSEU|nr:hypothetical protein [Actinokineospora cianjurensis]RLK58399.1 hypothetical protein CLV68_4499 [Actinokineospora cianjurensis]
MGYSPGWSWHSTNIDGATINWVTEGKPRADEGRVASVLDSGSSAPARRVLRDGTIEALGDSARGLTVFGSYVGDRPGPVGVGEFLPEYAELMRRFARGEGITHHYVTSRGAEPLLDMEMFAARRGLTYRTVRSYRSRGLLPAPDAMRGRSPQWNTSTADAWTPPGPGRGARTDLTG